MSTKPLFCGSRHWTLRTCLHLASCKAQRSITGMGRAVFICFSWCLLYQEICPALQVFSYVQVDLHANYCIKYKNFSLKVTVTNCSWNSKWKFIVAAPAKLVQFAVILSLVMLLWPCLGEDSTRISLSVWVIQEGTAKLPRKSKRVAQPRFSFATQ